MALNCPSPNYQGRIVPWEFALACGDLDPETLSFLPLGSLNNKTFELGTSTSDSTTDDSGPVTTEIVTYLTFTSTASGFATREDGSLSNQSALFDYFINEVTAGRQPSLWLRITFQDRTVYAYCNLTSFQRTAASTDTVSFEVSVTATSTGSAQAPIVSVPTP